MSKDRKHHKHGSLQVSWDGAAIAGVDRVSPLVRMVEVNTYRDGSSPSGGEHTAPGRVSSAPVTLERPVGGDTALEQWAGSAESIAAKKDVTVEVLDREGDVVLAYRIHRCWPSEYRVTVLEPGSRAAAVEQLRLENDGWERVEI
jgi:phage tail-like protein